MSELRDIPKHWQEKKLGDVCNVLDNLRKPINSSERQKRISLKSKDELFPYFGATGQVGWIDGFLTDGEYVLVGEDGAPFLDLFKDKAYKIKGKTWVNNHAHILQGKANVVLNDFVLYYLNSINYREFVNGTTRLKLTKSNLVDIPVVLPPLPEQQLIVSKIEELLSDLDNGKQQLQIAQQQLKVYRQSLLKWAFEGKLTNKTVIEGELPKGWKAIELKQVVDKISDGPFGSNLKSIDYVSEGIRVIRLENIGEMEFRNEYKTFVTPEKYEIIKNHTVGKGDIIFSSFVSESIRSVILPDYIENAINKADCFLVRVSESKINRKYLAYYFSTKEMRNQLINQIHGATRPRINTTQLKSSTIPFAPLKEQQLIVDELESKLTVCDKIEETISQSLRQAETLRQSILKKAFEGKLVSLNYDSDDEFDKHEMGIAAEPESKYKKI
jgi:type I restriction enzyme, S subunit